MACAADAQHRIVHHPVTIRGHTNCFGHDRFNFLRHHAELAAMAPLIAELGTVVEQVEANAKRVVANMDNVFFETLV